MRKTGFLDKSYVHIAAIALLGVLVYSNTLSVPFLFDDTYAILGNEMIRDLSNIPRLFTGGDWPFSSRPLMHATNAVNFYLGGANPAGYHAVNIALHVINASLLYFLILVAGRRIGAEAATARAVALLSSLVFVAHPAQTEAVTNIVNRSTLFAATFFFLGIILFLKAESSQKRRGLYTAALFAASMLGMASRENFATFPLVLVAFDLLIVSRLKLREALSHYKLHLAAALPVAYLVFLALNNSYDTVTPTLAGLSQKSYALTELKVHWIYLRLLVLPLNQTLDYDIAPIKSLLSAPALVSLAGYLGLWALGILYAKRRPVASLGLLWFLITLVPISFGVALLELKLDDVIFEHRLYLPGAGIIVALSAGAVMLYRRHDGAAKALVAVFSVAVLALAAAANARNSVWRTETRLWQDVIEKSPAKVRGYNNMGFALERAGRPDLAIGYYLKALGPGMSPAPAYFLARVHFNLAHAYELTGHLEEEMEHMRVGILLNSQGRNSFSAAADDFMRRGKVDEAIRYYLMAVESDPTFAPAHLGLAKAYRAKGLTQKADEHARMAEEMEKR